MNLIDEINKVHNQIKAKNFKEAIERCNKLIKKFPNNAYLCNLAGLACQQSQNIKASINYFQRSIDIDPKNLSAKNNLANSLKVIGKFDISEKLYREILKDDPIHVKCLNNYGNLKQQTNDYEESINLYKKALNIEPNNIVILMSLAGSYHSTGKIDATMKTVNSILKINPLIMSAHKLKSSLIQYDRNHSHLIEMINLSKKKDLSDEQKIDINFAIGKAHEDSNNYEEAFDSLKIANDLKNKIVKFDINDQKKLFESLKNTFNNINFNDQVANHDPKKIIFICGMPRSGTTLVEQIIASHSRVTGAGELVYLQQSVKNNFISEDIIQKNLVHEDVHAERVKMSKDYYDLIKLHNIKTDFITDKAPQNFRWLGFIKIFFPGSKIIHCKRNPKDTCLSLYKNSFASQDMNWSYSESNIASYYNLYLDLMNYWNGKFGNEIYEMNYEKLVTNKKTETENLLSFLKLDHEEMCFEHHKNVKTPIKTVSVSQARRPIYSTSVNKNEFYKNNLNKMFSLLDN